MDAVDTAVQSCISDDILTEFLIKNRSEVMLSVLTEFDEKKYEQGIREESFEEGHSKGLEDGETRFASLLQKLSELGRKRDIQLAINDPTERAKLYEEFGI